MRFLILIFSLVLRGTISVPVKNSASTETSTNAFLSSISQPLRVSDQRPTLEFASSPPINSTQNNTNSDRVSNNNHNSEFNNELKSKVRQTLIDGLTEVVAKKQGEKGDGAGLEGSTEGYEGSLEREGPIGEVFSKITPINGKIECENVGNSTTVYRIFVRDKNGTHNGTNIQNSNDQSSETSTDKGSHEATPNGIAKQLEKTDLFSYQQYATVYVEQLLQCSLDSLNVTKFSADIFGDAFTVLQYVINNKD